ncbi:unnamed protein product [Phytophthora fragariaefolia]|uniref:Unnamed protein product n=1 Tax=Phytophthora fragariaefolia TaxID=1490495 RepID=A0A9W6X0Z3_9STRA|nr:unnamed protein product [Phytophthora fragariaefolia]
MPPFQQRPRRPDTLPLFRGPATRRIADPHDFMDKFEATCMANCVPFEFWASLLVDSVRVQEMRFVRSIAQHGQPWTELRMLFLEHYYSPPIESARMTELMSCTRRHDESVHDFGDRFVNLKEKCHLNASDEGYKQRFTLKLTFPSAPGHQRVSRTLARWSTSSVISLATTLITAPVNLAEIDEGHAGFDEDDFSALMNEPLVNDATSDASVRMVQDSQTSTTAPVPPIEVPVVGAGRHLLRR